MHYENAHALLATLVKEPDFLAGLSTISRDEIVNSVAGGLAGENNIRDIIRFCGLVTKVRHNQLYEFVPLTFRALQGLSLEIDFFTSYASEFARMWEQRPLSLEYRLRNFAKHLQSYLQSKSRSHSFVAEVMRHELRLIDVRSSCDSAKVQAPPMNPTTGLDGEIRLAIMHWSPADIDSMAFEVEPITISNQYSEVPCHYAYFGRFGSQKVEFLELDEFSSKLIGLVADGKSVRAIATDLEKYYGVRFRPSKIIKILDGLSSHLPIHFLDS